MKRLFNVIVIITIITLVGCGIRPETSSEINKEKSDSTISIYATIFPLYDFAQKIGGEHVTVQSLFPPGTESHDFEPSAKDMVALNNAQIFVYNGAGYEVWIEKAIQNLDTEKTLVVNATEGLDLLAGHEEEEGEHAEPEGEEAHADQAEGEYDPHVWLDPMLAKEQANKILLALVQVDPDNQQTYQANYDILVQDLVKLDQAYAEVIAKAARKEIVVSHQAFSYLEERYGFEQIPVAGLSPSQEPSQKELMNIVDTLKAHNIKYIAYDALVESKVAQTIQRETGAEAVTLFTIENVTKEQKVEGKSYVDLMLENLETLKKVLEVQ